jgi:hypothetical protein
MMMIYNHVFTSQSVRISVFGFSEPRVDEDDSPGGGMVHPDMEDFNPWPIVRPSRPVQGSVKETTDHP